MHQKEFSIALDMVRANAFRPFEVVECDTGNVLHIRLTNDGEPMDLSGCNVCIVFASKRGFAMQDLTSGIALGTGLGTLSVTLYAESFGPGEVTADVQIYSGTEGDCLITSRRFTFRCITALMSPSLIQSSATYPPLVAATRSAVEAANRAEAAIGRIDAAIGDENVQSNWTETDEMSDAFILNKPTTFQAEAHAAKHATGGADPITPASIGAATAAAFSSHASRHATGGTDPITPAAIGAATKSELSTKTLGASDWSGTEAPFTQTISVIGVTATSAVEILPDIDITAEQLEALQAANMQDGGQASGSITLKAFGDKPELDLPIRIIVRGDL